MVPGPPTPIKSKQIGKGQTGRKIPADGRPAAAGKGNTQKGYVNQTAVDLTAWNAENPKHISMYVNVEEREDYVNQAAVDLAGWEHPEKRRRKP